MKERLAVQEIEMQKKNEAASLLLENVMAESTKVAKEKEKGQLNALISWPAWPRGSFPEVNFGRIFL